MSNVEFNDEHKASMLYNQLQTGNDEQPKLVGWIISAGLAQTPETANKILIGVIIAAFLATGIIIYQMNKGSSAQQFTPDQIKAMKNLPGMPALPR